MKFRKPSPEVLFFGSSVLFLISSVIGLVRAVWR